jgi:4-amino-4-deoxychorismate lyase
MNRLEQVVARSEWNSSGIQEGLMLDINGNIIEGTMSNIFLVKENVLYTPTIEQCGVEGIVRNIVISEAQKNQVYVVEKTLSKEDTKSADELFVTNSIIGIWPVKQLEEQRYAIGPLTQHLQKLLLAIRQEDIHAC